MITIISKKHIRYQDDRDVVIAVIAVTTSSELPTRDGIDNLRLHEASRAWDISNGVVYGFTSDGVWHEQPSGGSSAGAFVIKARVDTYEDLLLVSNPEPGWVYFVGYSTDTEFKEYVYTDQNVWQFVGYNSITVDSALSTTSENPVQNKVVTNAINGKQATLTTPQLNAVNSGIDSTKVSQIETNKNDITNLKNAPNFYVDNSGYISVDYGNE